MSQHINRRDFLKSSTAAIAAFGLPNIIPASAFGANDRISLGCIGVGGMGTGNMQELPQARRLPGRGGVRHLQGSAGRRPRTWWTRKYGDTGCAMFGDFRELIARKDIDAVMIAVQDHWHALIATAAAAAGKDMYCEKPMGSVRRGWPGDSQVRPQAQARVPGRHLAAVDREIPPGVRAGPQRLLGKLHDRAGFRARPAVPAEV